MRGHRRFFLIVFVFLVSIKSQALPHYYSFQSHGEQAFQVESFRNSSNEDLEEIQKALMAKISKEIEQNPHLQLEIHVDEHLSQDPELKDKLERFLAPIRKIAPIKILKDQVQPHPWRRFKSDLKRSIKKPLSWTFTLIKSLGISSASSLVLKIAHGLDWSLALAGGAAYGLLSGSVNQLADFLYEEARMKKGVLHFASQKLLSKEHVDLASGGLKARVKVRRWIAKVGRWTALELLFVYAAKIVLGSMGVIDPQDTNVWWSATLGALALGPWQLESETAAEKKRLNSVSNRDRLYFAKLGSLSASILSTGILMTLNLMGVPFTEIGFMAVCGIGLYQLVHHHKAGAEIEKLAVKPKDCQMKLLLR